MRAAFVQGMVAAIAGAIGGAVQSITAPVNLRPPSLMNPVFRSVPMRLRPKAGWRAEARKRAWAKVSYRQRRNRRLANSGFAVALLGIHLLTSVATGWAEPPEAPPGFRAVTNAITFGVKATRPGKAKSNDDRLCMQMCNTQDQGQRTYIAVSYDVSNLPTSITNKMIRPPGPGWIERNGCVYFPYTDAGTNWVHTIYESVGLP